MKYSLKLHRDVEKQLSRVPIKQRERLIKSMRSLCDEPRPIGCVKLDENLYRIREGRYRIIFAIFDKEVVVFICKVTKRTETTYRDLKNLLDRVTKELKG